MAALTGGENEAAISRTISNIERASADAAAAAGEAVDVAGNVGTVISNANLARVGSILGRLDSAAMELEVLLQTATRTTGRMEQAVSEKIDTCEHHSAGHATAARWCGSHYQNGR